MLICLMKSERTVSSWGAPRSSLGNTGLENCFWYWKISAWKLGHILHLAVGVLKDIQMFTKKKITWYICRTKSAGKENNVMINWYKIWWFDWLLIFSKDSGGQEGKCPSGWPVPSCKSLPCVWGSKSSVGLYVKSGT